MRFRSVAALGVSFVALPACFSSSNNPPPPAVDSGTPIVDAASPPVDATTVPEAAPPVHEAGIEAAVEAAAPVEAGPQPVTVRIIDSQGPESGVLIVFQDVAGNVVTTATTDVTGTVSALVASGSQVTAVMGSSPPVVVVTGSPGPTTVSDQVIAPPQNVQLVTVQGVEPGDVLQLVDPSDTTFSNATVSIDALPDAAPPPGTSTYQAQIGNCYSSFSSPPTQIGLSSGCQSNGAFPLLVLAQGGADAGYGTLGYTYQNDNTIPSDGGIAHVSATGAWFTTTTTNTIIESNSPLYTNFTSQYAALSGIQDGVEGYPVVDYLTEVDGGASATFVGYPGAATYVQSEGTVTQSDSTYSHLQVSSIAIRAQAPADGGSVVSFDLSTLLPFIGNVGLDAGAAPPDSGASGQPSVSWGVDGGSLASASGLVVQVVWSQGVGNNTGTWTIVAPPTATQVQAPVLPSSVAGWGPAPTASFSSPTIVVVQGSFFSGYSDLRKQFTAIPATNNLVTGQPYSGPVVPALPVNGTLRLTAYTINGD